MSVVVQQFERDKLDISFSSHTGTVSTKRTFYARLSLSTNEKVKVGTHLTF